MCPYCDDSAHLYPVSDHAGDIIHLCYECKSEYEAWIARDSECQRANAEGYDGPDYADTMSGGVVLL
jgi:hypothetical protein